MKRLIYLTLTMLFVFEVASAQSYRRWDFTKWSQQTIDNLKAEAAKERPAEGWSDIEAAKNDVAGAVAPDATKEKCFWYASSEFGALKANGEEIEELRGLTFGEGYSKNRSLAIAVDYASTAIGTYAGPQYLWLGGGNKAAGSRLMCFTIPNVTIGQKMTFVVESHRSGQGRGIGLYVNDVNDDANRIGDAFTPDAQETYTWENWSLPEGVTDEDGDGMVDILVYNTNGCHIYSIEIGENMEARNVGYLYNGDLSSELAYNILLEDHNNKVTAIEANKAFTLEDFSSFETLVISSTVSNEDAIASLKGIQPFHPILNLNPALYAKWGYGEAIDAGIPFATVRNNSHPLFNGIELIEDPDAATPTFVLELTRDLPFQGLTLSGLFANDPVLAYAYQNESVIAIHAHNLNHNGYLYIPYTQEALSVAAAPNIINNAVGLLASSKAPITQAPAPSFTLEYEHLNTFVSLKSNVPGAQIFYTTDGSTPTLESTPYTEPISITSESTVKAIAIGDGYLLSEVSEKLIDIRQMAPMPTFSMANEDGKTIVSIASELEAGQIYYNYKGSEDKAQSTLYSQPIEFRLGKDIYAFVVADSFLNSKLATAKVMVKNPKVRIDILSKMDANKEEYLNHTNPDTRNTDGTVGYYFSWGNTNDYPYYDPAGDQIVTGSDGISDSVIHTKLNAEEVVDIENGWSVRSRGHRISWEANNPGMKYGDANGFNPETVNDEDAYLPVTSYLLHLYDWDKTYPSSAIIQTTNKFAGPFDIVAYIANCQGGNPRPKVVFEVATSNDDNATWTVVGDTCEFDQPRRIYRKYTRSYEGTEEVYVRARIANDGSRAGFYNIYIANEGVESKKIIEEQATGITNINNDATNMPEAIYDLKGIRQSTLKPGLNIIRNSNGSTRKVFIK